MNRCKAEYINCLAQDSETKEMISYENNVFSRQSQYLLNESAFPTYKDTNVEYLAPGELFLPRLIDELKKAKTYIYLEFFIIAEGKMWDSIKNVLFEKALNGVEIKIIFDDFGSIKRQSKHFISDLRKHGIDVAIFNPIKPPFNVFMNNRDHRKIVIIDGNVAFTGGINIGDEYINEQKRFGYWMDSAVLIKGKAVDSFFVMFAIMWKYITNFSISTNSHLLSEPIENASFVIPYCDGPMEANYTAQGIYTQILNMAHRYVYITTPYLILDNNMISSLVSAAKSGVDVRIITPFIPDKKYVHPATQYHYTELLEAGVRIFEYTPGFMHSKLFLSDDNVATVGSVNMDFRSFVFHFECGVWFTDSATISEMKAHFNSLTKQSKEIFLNEWKKRSLKRKVNEIFFHLFSPLM